MCVSASPVRNAPWHAYLVNDILVVDLGTDRDEVPEELVDGIPRAEVVKLEQVRVGLDDGVDQALDLVGAGVGELGVQDVGLLDDGEVVVGGAGTRVYLWCRAGQTAPRGEERHGGGRMDIEQSHWARVDEVSRSEPVR